MSTASGRPASPITADATWRLGDPLPPDADVHDELLAGPDMPRPHWTRFADSLARLGPQELARPWELSRRLLRENGVTYNVYGDPRGTDRPWELDPLPLLLAPDEWQALEAGLAQRAQLLNLILADLYGPQRLLRDGDQHVTVAWGRDYADVSPLRGVVLGGGAQRMTVAVDVTPLD
jgi:hypothetical protein